MSEEILYQESEEEEVEMVEEDSSDKEEIVAESGKSKASVKVDEEGDEEEEEDPEEEVKKEEVTPVPKTKNGMLKSVYEKLNSLKKDELTAKYEAILKATALVEEDDEEEADEEKVESKRTKAAIKAEDLNIDVKDDVEALIQGEDGLTEEFKEKASTIFEAAVQAKVIEEVNKKAEEIETQIKEDQDKSSEGFQKELTEKVDGYLTYVVEEWMSENELAIDRGIQREGLDYFRSCSTSKSYRRS